MDQLPPTPKSQFLIVATRTIVIDALIAGFECREERGERGLGRNWEIAIADCTQIAVWREEEGDLWSWRADTMR